MANTIKLKRGTSTPSTSDISNGEVAIDTSAKKLYINDSGTVKEIGGSGSVGGASGLDFNDNVKVRFGTGNDAEIYHSSSDNRTYIRETGGGAMCLQGDYIKLQKVDGSEDMAVFQNDATVELYYDNAKKFETTSAGATLTGDLTITDDLFVQDNLFLGDTDCLRFGDSEDLEIQHNGSNNVINYKTGNLIIKQGTHTDAESPQFDGNGNLYIPDNNQVYFGGSSDLTIYHSGSHSYIKDTGTGNLNLAGSTVDIINAADSEFLARFKQDDNVELYYDNSKKFETTSAGVKVTGQIEADEVYLRDSEKILLGTGSDFEIYYNGSYSFVESTAGALILRGAGGSDWIHIEPKTDENGILIKPDGAVELYYDNAKKLYTDSNGVRMDDSVWSYWGTDQDMWMGHNGSHGFIKNGTGNLNLRTGGTLWVDNGGGTETYIKAVENGAVELYYDNSKKFETTSGGVVVTGELNCDNLYLGDSEKIHLGASDDLQLFHDGSNSYLKAVSGGTGNLYIFADGKTIFLRPKSGEDGVKVIPDGAVELYYDNAKKLDTHSQGVNFYGSISGDDGDEVRLGTGNDMILRHNGSNSFIENSTGNLILRPKTDEEGLILRADGSSDLYYDNSKKLNTHADGIEVLGKLYMADSKNIELGNSQDLKIWHSGDSNITNDTGDLLIQCTGDDINIKAADDIRLKPQGDESGVLVYGNAAVELYYDNSNKAETYSNGFKINGQLQCEGDVKFDNPDNAGRDVRWDSSDDALEFSDNTKAVFGDGSDCQLFHDGSNSFIKNSTNAFRFLADDWGVNDENNGEELIQASAHSSVKLYYDNVEMIRTTSSGLRIPDSKYLYFGAGEDMWMGHNGSHNYIKASGSGQYLYLQTASGSIHIEAKSGESSIWCGADSDVELYYDGAKKLETTSAGVNISGQLRMGSGYIEGPGEKALHIGSTDAGGAAIYLDGDSNGDWAGSDYSVIRHSTGGDIFIGANNPSGDGHINLYVGQADEAAGNFYANGAAELCYDGTKKFETKSTGAEVSGRLSINEGGQLVNESGLTVDSSGNTCCFRATGAAGHNPLMLWNDHTSGDRSQIQFADGGSYSARGSITTNGSNTSFNTSSDYRLKQDDVLITDGLTKVNALKPKRFKWKDNLSIGICDGFFAHEVQEVAPTSRATIGTKDEVDSDGNPVYQSIDQSKLIPLLTAAIQELSAEINTLKTKVTALEAA